MKRPRDLFGNVIRATREDAIHAGIVEYLTIAAHPRLMWFHCPTGALVKPSARMYFARLGVFPGVADLVLILPDRTVAFLEVKGEDGRQSEAQKAFQARCAVLGLKYRIARSISEAEETLKDWGALRGTIANSSEPVADSWESIGEVVGRVVSKLASTRSE